MICKYVTLEEFVYFAKVICYHFKKVLTVNELHIWDFALRCLVNLLRTVLRLVFTFFFHRVRSRSSCIVVTWLWHQALFNSSCYIFIHLSLDRKKASLSFHIKLSPNNWDWLPLFAWVVLYKVSLFVHMLYLDLNQILEHYVYDFHFFWLILSVLLGFDFIFLYYFRNFFSLNYFNHMVVIRRLIVSVHHNKTIFKPLVQNSLKELQTNVCIFVHPLPPLYLEDFSSIYI